jgi:ketosteroid isomerase-like protein
MLLYTNKVQSMQSTDEQQITQLFEDGDRALIGRNVDEILRIYADDYIQYDELGKSSTREDLVHRLTSRAIRFRSMASTGRSIRMLRDDVALVNGSEEDEVEQNGRCSTVRYVYTDVAMKRDGRWQIVASQLAKPLLTTDH